MSVTRVNGGWKVVTSTVYPDDKHAPTLAFAQQLRPPCAPLGPNPLGPNRPVFITEVGACTATPRAGCDRPADRARAPCCSSHGWTALRRAQRLRGPKLLCLRGLAVGPSLRLL